MSTISDVYYERIFTTVELTCLEHQLSLLIVKMKELKAYCKDELKKILLRLEKEQMDAAQTNNRQLIKMYKVYR